MTPVPRAFRIVLKKVKGDSLSPLNQKLSILTQEHLGPKQVAIRVQRSVRQNAPNGLVR